MVAAALVALCALLSGCSSGPEEIDKKSTSPGARPPATTPEEASRILRAYLTAMSSPDAAAIKSVEASTARTVHTAQLRLGAVTPSLAAEFAIPRFTSYPRWFAAGAVGTGMTGDVAIFVRSSEDAPWRVHRLVYLSRPMPELSRDAEGYVSVADPGDVPTRRLKYFADELGDPGLAATGVEPKDSREDDADDASTSLIEGLRQNTKLFTSSFWKVEQKFDRVGRSYALKTKDGGTVVWYVLSYGFSAVNAAGRFEITLADEAARMLRGNPTVGKGLAWNCLYQSVAYAPATGDDKVLGVSLPGWTRMVGA